MLLSFSGRSLVEETKKEDLQMKPAELQKKVYEAYYNLMSIEMREEIKTYRPLPKKVPLPPGSDKNSAIKVIFRDKNWLRVYLRHGSLEWY
jgi:hypothetical protein